MNFNNGMNGGGSSSGNNNNFRGNNTGMPNNNFSNLQGVSSHYSVVLLFVYVL